MTTGVGQNVTISDSANFVLTIGGVAGTGIQIDSTVGAFTLTISTGVAINAAQAWTNNSSNLFTVSGNVALGAALTVNGTGDTLISGILAGGGASSLTKDGTGTLTLTSANTYDGDTTVNNGTLLVNNTVGSGTGMGDVIVNTGGTLGGTGIISGAVTVNAGGNLSPGNGGNNTETLQISGALTMAATSNFRVDINGSPASGNFDQIVAGGTVNVTGSNLVVTVGTIVTNGDVFTIVNKTSGGAVTGTFAGIPQGGTVVGSDGTVFQVSYTGGTGNDITLTVIAAAVPEPSTYIGGALAIAGLAFTQRRRLKRLIARRCPVGS
jgi:autotransporter-associated beta strand protein